MAKAVQDASLDSARLEQLPDFQAAKRRLAPRDQALLDGIGQVGLMQEPPDCASHYWLPTLILRATAADQRDASQPRGDQRRGPDDPPGLDADAPVTALSALPARALASGGVTGHGITHKSRVLTGRGLDTVRRT